MKTLLAFIPGLIVCIISLLAATRMNYELRADGLCVVMFGVSVRRIPYANIQSVRRGSALWNEHWNRIAFDPCITLRLKTGLVRNFVINPPHTDEFLRELQARL